MFKKLFSKVNEKVQESTFSPKKAGRAAIECVKDFDVGSAAKATVETAKVMPGIISAHAKAMKVHYDDLKLEKATRPKVVNCKVERMDEE